MKGKKKTVKDRNVKDRQDRYGEEDGGNGSEADGEDPVALYVKETGARKHVSREEERTLAMKVETALRIIKIRDSLAGRTGTEPGPADIAAQAMEDLRSTFPITEAIGRRAGIKGRPKNVSEMVLHSIDRRSLAEISASADHGELLPLMTGIGEILADPRISRGAKQRIRKMILSEEEYSLKVLADPRTREEIEGPIGQEMISELAQETGLEEKELWAGITTIVLSARILDGQTQRQKTLEQYLNDLVQEGQQAREELILTNQRMVIKIAKQFTGHNVPLTDLAQQGNLGLMKAIDGFDPRRGRKMGTYAMWWIQQAVHRSLPNQSKPIRLPLQWQKTIREVERARWELCQVLGRDPESAEIAERIGEPTEKVERAVIIAQTTLSLDREMGHDGDSQGDYTLKDMLGDTAPAGQSEYEEEASNAHLRESVQQMLEEFLDPLERQVLTLRHGISESGEDRQNLTLEETGRLTGRSKETVRLIQARAEQKLRDSVDRERIAELLQG